MYIYDVDTLSTYAEIKKMKRRNFIHLSIADDPLLFCLLNLRLSKLYF